LLPAPSLHYKLGKLTIQIDVQCVNSRGKKITEYVEHFFDVTHSAGVQKTAETHADFLQPAFTITARHLHNSDNTIITTATTTTVLRPVVRDYLGELVPEERFTHPPSWSSSNLYQLLPSTTINSILLVQITCLTILLHKSSFVYLLVWSPPPQSPYISLPNQCLLFATHVHTFPACFAV